MTPIRTVLVDDEPHARQRLRELLADQEDFAVVGEAGDAAQAADVLRRVKPDLVFLDVRMPGRDGFELLDAGRSDAPPLVVFVTAFERYALKAFDVEAVDYLLKPFEDDRFSESLERVRERFHERRAAALGDQMLRLAAEHKADTGEHVVWIEVERDGRTAHVAAGDVEWIEAAGNYVLLHEREREHIVRNTMRALAQALAPADFLRIHRSAIVRKDAVNSVRYIGNNEYRFVLRGGKTLVSGRSYREDIATWVEAGWGHGTGRSPPGA